jgi:hypothetical protein
VHECCLFSLPSNTAAAPYYDPSPMHRTQSVMALARSCAYPVDYFGDLSSDNDDELEQERNDVRDILRTVTASSESSSASLQILCRLVQECSQTIQHPVPLGGGALLLPPEVVVHTLSALAKPLNGIAARLSATPSAVSSASLQEDHIRVLDLSLEALCKASEQTSHAFDNGASVAEVLPVARIICLGTSSLCPLFSAIFQSNEISISQSHPQLGNSSGMIRSLKKNAAQTLQRAVRAIFKSIVVLPELCFMSTLGETQYDIRGAMRAPGGEDHCGCISLSRLCQENAFVCAMMWRTYGNTSIWSGTNAAMGSDQNNNCSSARQMVMDLVQLHEHLKKLEQERGVGVHHGNGVMPKSRRILLHVISYIAMNATRGNVNDVIGEVPDAVSIQSGLQDLVESPLHVMLSFPTVEAIDRSQWEGEVKPNEEIVYQLCEACYDLAAFPKDMLQSLSHVPRSKQFFDKAMDVVVSHTTRGYSLSAFAGKRPDQTEHHVKQVSHGVTFAFSEVYCIRYHSVLGLSSFIESVTCVLQIYFVL